MENKNDKLVEKLFDSDSDFNTADELQNINPEEREEYSELLNISKWIDGEENKLSASEKDKSLTQLQYAINDIKKNEQSRHWSKSFFRSLENMKAAFWGWIILRFNLMEDRTLVLPRRVNSNLKLSTGHFFFFAILLIFTVVLVLHKTEPNVNNTQIVENYKETKRFIANEETHIVALGERIKMAMNQNTEVLQSDENSIELLNGSVWLDVTKGGVFRVKPPFGSVWVIGTSLGIESSSDYFKLEVSEGIVEYYYKGTKHIVTAGEQLEVMSDGVVSQKKRASEDLKPRWVRNLQNPENQITITDLNPALWLEGSSQNIKLTNNQISQWLDQSGNERHAYSVSEFLKPKFKILQNSSGVNFNTADFHGAGAYAMEVGWVPQRGDYTAIVVASNPPDGDGGGFLAQHNSRASESTKFGIGNANHSAVDQGQIVFGSLSSAPENKITLKSESGYFDNDFHLFGFRVEGNSYEMFCDDEVIEKQKAVPGVFDGSENSKLVIGRMEDDKMRFLNSYIAEIIIFPYALDEQDLTEVKQSLIGKYN